MQMLLSSPFKVFLVFFFLHNAPMKGICRLAGLHTQCRLSQLRWLLILLKGGNWSTVERPRVGELSGRWSQCMWFSVPAVAQSASGWGAQLQLAIIAVVVYPAIFFFQLATIIVCLGRFDHDFPMCKETTMHLCHRLMIHYHYHYTQRYFVNSSVWCTMIYQLRGVGVSAVQPSNAKWASQSLHLMCSAASFSIKYS